MLLSQPWLRSLPSNITDLHRLSQNTSIRRRIAEDYHQNLVRGREGMILWPPPSRRDPSIWILLERLSVVKESLGIRSMRDCIVLVGRQGGGIGPLFEGG